MPDSEALDHDKLQGLRLFQLTWAVFLFSMYSLALFMNFFGSGTINYQNILHMVWAVLYLWAVYQSQYDRRTAWAFALILPIILPVEWIGLAILNLYRFRTGQELYFDSAEAGLRLIIATAVFCYPPMVIYRIAFREREEIRRLLSQGINSRPRTPTRLIRLSLVRKIQMLWATLLVMGYASIGTSPSLSEDRLYYWFMFGSSILYFLCAFYCFSDRRKAWLGVLLLPAFCLLFKITHLIWSNLQVIGVDDWERKVNVQIGAMSLWIYALPSFVLYFLLLREGKQIKAILRHSYGGCGISEGSEES